MLIHSLAIFWALAYLESEAYFKSCETLTRHIQNPTIGHHSAIFRHILNLVQRLHMQKPEIFGIMEYSEPFHNYIQTYIQNPVIHKNLPTFRTLTYLKPDTYAEPSQRFKMEFFSKIVKNYNYFSKVLHLRSLIELWKHNLCISTHYLLERPCTMYCMIHIQNLVYYWKFRHIQAYSHPAQTCSAILWHV